MLRCHAAGGLVFVPQHTRRGRSGTATYRARPRLRMLGAAANPKSPVSRLPTASTGGIAMSRGSRMPSPPLPTGRHTHPGAVALGHTGAWPLLAWHYAMATARVWKYRGRWRWASRFIASPPAFYAKGTPRRGKPHGCASLGRPGRSVSPKTRH